MTPTRSCRVCQAVWSLWGKGTLSNQRAIPIDVHGVIFILKDFLRALDDQDPQTIVRALRTTADRIEADERERQARTRSDEAKL
jgi:hypothetical protein